MEGAFPLWTEKNGRSATYTGKKVKGARAMIGFTRRQHRVLGRSIERTRIVLYTHTHTGRATFLFFTSVVSQAPPQNLILSRIRTSLGPDNSPRLFLYSSNRKFPYFFSICKRERRRRRPFVYIILSQRCSFLMLLFRMTTFGSEMRRLRTAEADTIEIQLVEKAKDVGGQVKSTIGRD